MKEKVSEEDAFLILIMLSYVNPSYLKDKAREFYKTVKVNLNKKENAFRAVMLSKNPVQVIRDSEDDVMSYLHKQMLNQTAKTILVFDSNLPNSGLEKQLKKRLLSEKGEKPCSLLAPH